MTKNDMRVLPKAVVPVENIIVLRPDFEEIKVKNKSLIEEAKARRAAYKRRYHIGT